MSNVFRAQDWVVISGGTRKIPSPVILRRETLAEEPADETTAVRSAELLQAAEEQAAAIVRQAEQAAAERLAAVEREAEEIREQARAVGHQAGFEAGYAEGRAAGEASLQARIDTEWTRAQEVARAAIAARGQLILQMAAPLTELCMAAVERLLARELALQPADIAGLVDEMLQVVSDATMLEVRVHPDDYHLALAAEPTWQSGRYGQWTIGVVPDAGVEPGGCEVVWESGRADGRLSTKLDSLRAELTSFLERSVKEYVASALG
ncbi:hypothetical protein GCM10025857_03960 [Alicyclobacillus contaminans]|uniref:FliH/SctL family protein n=1 Tax=Alicyclobacillus contaminans TaxID=392016 RepID=UPI00042109AE|nr:FliH/SctL family protein [Alicyclobacillus contaminans]GMA49039.1 hypothetical protein GCM10025857_03960 [Alicyclobacillus contaminans]